MTPSEICRSNPIGAHTFEYLKPRGLNPRSLPSSQFLDAMISNSLAMQTFSEPKDHRLDFPMRIQSSSTMLSPFDSMIAPAALYHAGDESASFGFRPQHVQSNIMTCGGAGGNKRNLDDIMLEPVPIGPRRSLKVVDEIPVQDTTKNMISFDQDLLIETFLPAEKSTDVCCPEKAQSRCSSSTEDLLIELGSELRNKRRKLAATVTPRSSMIGSSSSTTESLTSWYERNKFSQESSEHLSSATGQKEETTEQEEDEYCEDSSSSSDGDEIHLAPPDHCWYSKYKELCAFHNKYGHCIVPSKTPEGLNCQSLSQWVKRQRHQHKRKRLGRHSTLNEDREVALNKLGFVWDSHGATWNEKFSELLAFKASHGHCNVPTEFPENPQLSIWVKCQRRQYKLFLTGKKSNISATRMDKLNEVGFVWNPRNLKF